MASLPAGVSDKDALIASLYRKIDELELENQRLQAQLAHSRSFVIPTSSLPPRGDAGLFDRHTPIEGSIMSSRRASLSVEVPNAEEAKVEGVCSNCGREIPSASLTMHQLHCLRNIKKCSGCGKPIPVKEYDQHLLENKATPSRMMAAVVGADVDLLDRFLQHGGSVSEVCDGETGELPMHAAARARQIRSMKYLLSHGASINACNASGETPLHISCMMAPPPQRPGAPSGSLSDMVDALDVVLEKPGSTLPPALATPAEMISFLVGQGCDVEARNALGDTPLQILQRSSNMELALLLTSSGSSLRPSSRDNRTRPASASSLSRIPTPLARQPAAESARGIASFEWSQNDEAHEDAKMDTRIGRPPSARDRDLVPTRPPPRPVSRSNSFRGINS